MKVKTKVLLGLFLCFCAFMCIATYLHTPSTNGSTFGDEQDAPPIQPGTRRVDLGDGLELVETVECENDELLCRRGKVTRQGETLLEYSSIPSLGIDLRQYYHNGKEVVSEALDEDGRLETLILTDTDGMMIEAFERQKDGTILPLGSKRLEEMKRAGKLIDETFGPIVEAAKKGNADEQEIRGLVEDAVKKTEKAAEQSSRHKKN